MLQYRPLEMQLGSGEMVSRHTLDVKFGVRNPTPQPKTPCFEKKQGVRFLMI